MAETSALVTAELQLKRELASKAQGYYEAVKTSAEIACKAFGDDRRQMRSLETLVFRARSPVDVFAFIKSQTGKEGKPNKGWRLENFGPQLLNALEGLRGEAEELVKKVYPDVQNVERVMDVHLELVRLYVRYLVSQYLYGRVEPQKGERQ